MPNFEAVVRRYLELFPSEEPDTASVRAFLEDTPTDAERISRGNFNAHLTASCLLVDPLKRQILLFRHPRHDKLLQPGGHYESPTESPSEAATRKLRIETPFKSDQFRYLPYDFNEAV